MKEGWCIYIFCIRTLQHDGMIIVGNTFYFTRTTNYIYNTYVFNILKCSVKVRVRHLFKHNYDIMPIGPKTDIVPKVSSFHHKWEKTFTKIINVTALTAFVDETSTTLSDAGIRAVLFVMLERIPEVGCTCLRTIVISKCFVWIWKKCGLWIKVKNIVIRTVFISLGNNNFFSMLNIVKM